MAELFYRGPSEIDGMPIRGYISHNSSNRKTGDMLQTWIIRDDISPTEACRTGTDSSVCGNCPHRPANDGTCYVLTHQAPTAIWRSQSSSLPASTHGKPMRLGAYGDPTAIPYGQWVTLMTRFGTVKHTGYTHQWSTCDERFKTLCMASVDTPEEYDEAVHRGWRTFRVKTSTCDLKAQEIICPSSRGVSCADCSLCAGTSNTGKNIAIDVHGSKGKVNLFEKNYATKTDITTGTTL